jgi:GNAT superfamily N-acetyltransferase
MTEIRKLTVDEYYAEPNIAELWELYAEESHTKGLPPHNPQRQMYQGMENVGVLHTWGAYDDGKLVGFIALLVHVAPHYGAMLGTLESFFVHRYYRKGGTASKLLRAAEAKAKELGAVGLFASAPAGGKLEKAMLMFGYRHTNTVFFRGLT